MAPVATGTLPTTEPPTILRRDPYRWLAGFVVLLAAVLAARRPWSGDLGIHAATVERLRISFTHPGNPLVDADTPSPYYSPYTLALGAIARLTGLSSLAVLWVAGPVVIVLLLWGLRAFVRTLSDRLYAPVLALVFLLLLWGLDTRVWSGFFSLWALPLVMAFPSTLALGLTLLLWAGLSRTLDRPVSLAPYLALGLLAALVALVHPFTVLTAALGVLAIVAHRSRGLSRPAWLALGAAAAAAAILALSWPYWSFVALLRAGGELDAIHRALYDRPLLYYGLILVALPALWLRWRRNRLDPLVLLFASAVVMVALGGLTGRYALGRVWPAVLLSGQLALAGEVSGPLPWRLARLWLPATALACLAGLAAQAGNLLYLLPHSMLTPGIRRGTHMYVDWPDYSWLGRYLKPGDVVLTPDEHEDYFAVRTVPAYGGRTVMPAWPDPFLPDDAQRHHDLVTMWDPATDPATRTALLSRYRVRWVLAVSGEPKIENGHAPIAVGPLGQRLYATR